MSIITNFGEKAASGPELPDLLLIISRKVTLGADREIFGEGTPSPSWYIVSDGIVRLTKFTVDGRRCVPAILFAGDCFGLDHGIERPVSAETVTPVTLREFDMATTERMAEAHSGIAAYIREMLSLSAAAKQEHILALSCLSAMERLAGFLLGMWERGGQRPRVRVPIGRTDIADYLGMRSETLSRTLSRLRGMGIVECISTEEIMIMSPRRLRAVVSQGRRLPSSASAGPLVEEEQFMREAREAAD